MEAKISGSSVAQTIDLPKIPQIKKVDQVDKEVSDLLPKDNKNIDKKSSAPIKSEPINFLSDPSLTKQKIEGVASKAIISSVSKISIQTASKSIAKVETKVISENVAKIATKTVGATVEKAFLKSLWVNGSQTVFMSAGEEVTLKILEKSAANVAKKGGQEASKRISAAVPIVGALIEAGFTLYDAKYAYELSKDKNATMKSKVLAWATVGLDAVSMVCTATGVGTPIAWGATALSVVTSVASDMTRYKK
ncbi:MAG: hypothetical protein AABZ74_00880 [Cyanobacteriota bacterium]